MSLFFIDRVANYRYYDENGEAQKGKYAIWFEELYREVSSKPKYRTLFNDIDLAIPVEELHNGYFSQDKKGKLKDTNGSTLADDDTYSLIMKDKEKLLNMNTPLKFIFSHSALKEGWDNPNVFQICTLNETKQEIKKRQEIGRGLRLCVNQNGERLKGFEINTLTVMANESYDDFAQKLQSEIEAEEGIKFGLIETHTFANIQVVKEDGTETTLGYDKSAELFLHCKTQGYIDEKGIVTDTLRQAIKTNTVTIPEEFSEVKSAIYSTLRKSCGTLNIKNADEKVEIKLNKQVQLSPEFKDLWDRIKWKTRYNVAFDTNELIEKCAKRLNEKVVITSSTLKETKATLNVTQGGVQTSETQNRARLVNEEEKLLPDIISYLQNETDLTRKSDVDIMQLLKNCVIFDEEYSKDLDDLGNKFEGANKAILIYLMVYYFACDYSSNSNLKILAGIVCLHLKAIAICFYNYGFMFGDQTKYSQEEQKDFENFLSILKKRNGRMYRKNMLY